MKYLGLINIVFVLTVITLIIKDYKRFKFDKLSYSDLGSRKKVGFLFNATLIIFSLNQVLFAVAVSHSLIANILFVLGGIFLALAGIFTVKTNGNLHTQSAFISAIFVITGVIILTVDLLKTNVILGALALLATLLIPVTFKVQKRLPAAKWETLMFICVFIWNLVFSIPLLFP